MTHDENDRRLRRASHDPLTPVIRSAYRADPDSSTSWTLFWIVVAAAALAIIGCVWVYVNLPPEMRV